MTINFRIISVAAWAAFAMPALGAETNIPPAFTPLRLGEVKPAGWLRDWCQDAAHGITGHSDELDPLFARGWMDADIKATGTGAQAGDKMVGYALEQAGYWVDGAVRLAHLIDDDALLAKCRLRFETVLKRVEAGNPPVPKTNLWLAGEKWGHWPMAIMGRAMLAEYSFTGDARYLRALEKIYANYPQYNAGKKFSLIHHQGRQLMNIEVMCETYRFGGDARLRDDAVTVLRQQSAEIQTRLGWHELGIATGNTHEHFYSVPFGHAVTLNESAKLPAIGYLYTGEADWLRFSEACFADMEKNEMMPYGLTSAHEHLAGIGPFSCTELCNAIDFSWSAIWLLRVTGNSTYADRVERAMFNAAPSGIAPDFKSHQYFLSPNRIDVQHPGRYEVGGSPAFEPKQFPLCCTGNLSRLLPDYVMHLWMASRDGGLAATLYGPSDTKTKVAGVNVALATRTDYPFRNDVTITLTPDKPVSFPLHLRVPGWCAQPVLVINDQPQPVTVGNGFLRVQREWKAGDVVRLSFPNQPRILTGVCADGAPFTSVCYGPLLFALPIPTVGNDLNQPQAGTPWQFALSRGSAVTVKTQPMPPRWSWRETPVELAIDAVTAKFGKDFSLPRQEVSATGPVTKLTLVPIGSTAFRVSMFGVTSAAAPVLIDGKTAAERIQAFANYCGTVEPPNNRDPRVALVYLAARIACGKDTAVSLKKWQEIASAVYGRSTARLEANPKDNNARNPFEKHALIHSYLICREKTAIPAKLVETMRNYVALYKHRVWFGYGALNYRVMNDGAGFIAAELWPELVDADGLNAEQIRKATKNRLFGYFDEIVRVNTEEYGAPTYLGIDFSAVKMLADFAKDPEMKRRAACTLDSMLLQVACAWNNGYYVSPASRAKYWSSTMTCPERLDTTAGIGWLYFGGLRPVDPAHMNVGGAFWFAGLRDYRPPGIFTAIACDRSRPFIHRGSAHERIRFTIFQGPQYAVASEWEYIPDPNGAHYKESRRTMFKWVSDRPDSTFVPLQDNPQRPYRLGDGKANAFGYGENPFGQSLQCEGALIGICAVPDNYPHWKSYAPFTIDGAIRKRLEKDGWVFCHGGSVLFAFRYLQPSYWGPPRINEKCDVLRSDSRKNGWVLQTAPVPEFAGGGESAELARFAEAVMTKTKLDPSKLNAATPRFSYQSLTGHTLDITFRAHKEAYTNQHLVDGQPVNYNAFPLFDNPWVTQPFGGDTLTICHDGKTLTYDFKNWTRKEGTQSN